MGVHINFVISEFDAILWLLVENNIKWDLVISILRLCEHWVKLHFLPAWSMKRVVLHSLIKKVKSDQWNYYVGRPTPRTFLQLGHERWHSILTPSLLFYAEDKHTCKHLVENDSDGPHINFVIIAGAATPVGIQLLRRHHQWRAFKRLCSALILSGQLPRVT